MLIDLLTGAPDLKLFLQFSFTMPHMHWEKFPLEHSMAGELVTCWPEGLVCVIFNDGS